MVSLMLWVFLNFPSHTHDVLLAIPGNLLQYMRVSYACEVEANLPGPCSVDHEKPFQVDDLICGLMRVELVSTRAC